MHDYWLALRVAKYGIVDNLKEQTILYRQHGNNEAGAGELYKKRQISFSLFLKKWGMSMSDVKNVLAMVLGCGFIIVFIFYL